MSCLICHTSQGSAACPHTCHGGSTLWTRVRRGTKRRNTAGQNSPTWPLWKTCLTWLRWPMAQMVIIWPGLGCERTLGCGHCRTKMSVWKRPTSHPGEKVNQTIMKERRIVLPWERVTGMMSTVLQNFFSYAVWHALTYNFWDIKPCVCGWVCVCGSTVASISLSRQTPLRRTFIQNGTLCKVGKTSNESQHSFIKILNEEGEKTSLAPQSWPSFLVYLGFLNKASRQHALINWDIVL